MFRNPTYPFELPIPDKISRRMLFAYLLASLQRNMRKNIRRDKIEFIKTEAATGNYFVVPYLSGDKVMWFYSLMDL